MEDFKISDKNIDAINSNIADLLREADIHNVPTPQVDIFDNDVIFKTAGITVDVKADEFNRISEVASYVADEIIEVSKDFVISEQNFDAILQSIHDTLLEHDIETSLNIESDGDTAVIEIEDIKFRVGCEEFDSLSELTQYITRNFLRKWNN